MFMCGPNFFSSAAGDHTPGDGLTRLQTLFAGASSADVSSYAIGSGTNIGGTVNNGYYEVQPNAGGFKRLIYSNAGLGRADNTAHTFEFFVRITEVDVDPVGLIGLAACDMDNMTGSDWSVNGGSLNPLAVSAGVWFSWADSVAAYNPSGYHHIAHVWQANPAGDLAIYVDGVRIVNRAGGGSRVAGTPSLSLGGFGNAGSASNFKFTGVRVRRAAMYSGASFAPPLSPADWGAP